MQIRGNAGAIDAAHEFLRIIVVVLVDDSAHADVGAHTQSSGHVHDAISAAPPVVVLHLPSVHRPDAISGVHDLACVAHAVLQCCHDADGFEYRSRLHEVADGVVLDLLIDDLSVGSVALVDVDDGFDVARLHFHDDRHAHVAVDLRLFEFFDDGSFGQVLNAYVDGRDDVATVDRLFVDDVEILVEHLAAVSDTIGTTEQFVERQLQTTTWHSSSILQRIHITHRALSERTKRILA